MSSAVTTVAEKRIAGSTLRRSWGLGLALKDDGVQMAEKREVMGRQGGLRTGFGSGKRTLAC